MDLFCSTVIPTVNRPTLSAAVESVLSQQPRAGAEVIVVNDSGAPLPPMSWQSSRGVSVLTTGRHERSVARNAGAAVARGRYLHFLDDDDLLLPGALTALETLSETVDNSGVWLYGDYRTVDREGDFLAEFRPGLVGNIFAMLVAGESIPFQASLLRTSAFFRAGGFWQDPAIVGVEDRELGRRLALLGTVAYTPVTVATIRVGENGSTTNWATIAEGDRLGREQALSRSRAFARARESASSCYWRGRVARAYLASGGWNLRRGRFGTCTQRTAAAAAIGAPALPAPSFWRGLLKPAR